MDKCKKHLPLKGGCFFCGFLFWVMKQIPVLGRGDSVWDSGMQDYLDAGGQAIMDEREEKWNAAYGDAEMVP